LKNPPNPLSVASLGRERGRNTGTFAVFKPLSAGGERFGEGLKDNLTT
jgi:hypothetical protein